MVIPVSKPSVPVKTVPPTVSVTTNTEREIADLKAKIKEQKNTLSQLDNIVSEFISDYPEHTQAVPAVRPGEDPLIATVRHLVSSLDRKNELIEEISAKARALDDANNSGISDSSLDRACRIDRLDHSSDHLGKRRGPLVDDNLISQKVAHLTLKSLGFEVQVVSNGADAVEAAITQEFDLICMDVQMPVMDGIEASRRIRELDSPSSTAGILAMTGHTFREDRKWCLACGIDDYITKPFDFFELKEKLDHLLAAADGTPETSASPEAVALSS